MTNFINTNFEKSIVSNQENNVHREVSTLVCQIELLSLELVWAQSTKSSFAHAVSDLTNDSEKSKELIQKASAAANMNEKQVEALLKRNVKELSCPENIKAVHEVFSILARWRDEAKAKKSSVVDDSNQIITTQTKKRNI
jgi:hypothetical protein